MQELPGCHIMCVTDTPIPYPKGPYDMTSSFTGKSFLKLLDFSREEILYLIDLSAKFKALKRNGILHRYLKGKNIVLIFEKTSTRTRCAFEVAAYDLGMGATYLAPGSSQLGNKESVADTARVLGSMYDGIEYRGFAQSTVDELAKYSGCPVYNGLTDEFHPTQMIADMLTVHECFPEGFSGLKLAFFGDACNNVANSLMVVCAKLGIDYVACGPKDRMPDEALVDECRRIAEDSGSTITLTDDVVEGATDANIIYTDIWLSMGEDEHLWKERIDQLSPYRITSEIMEMTATDSIFMHCLPSFHNTDTAIGARIAEDLGIDELEVTDEVFESSRSVVFQEAENRLHSIKAVIYATLSDEDPISNEEI